MECEDISLISKNERETKEITPLPTTFYRDVEKYMHELEGEIEKSNNPSSKEYLMLSDELNTSIGRIEEIFFLRRNKIYSMAAQTSNLSFIQHKNYNRLLPEEKKMYDTLIHSGNTLKKELLDPTISLEEETAEIEEENKQECVLVRVLKDVPTFMGTDGRNYTIKAEDTLMLPLENAEGLIKRNVAQLIEH